MIQAVLNCQYFRTFDLGAQLFNCWFSTTGPNRSLFVWMYYYLVGLLVGWLVGKCPVNTNLHCGRTFCYCSQLV